MKTTTNYQLKKLELPDSPPDITQLNPNWDTIDNLIKSINTKLSDILLLAWPIGSIYESTVSTNPSMLFGGTWEAMDAGRVLVSAGTATSGTIYTIGTKNGEEKHKQTLEELVTHNHTAVSDSQGKHNHSGTTSADGIHSHTTTFGVNEGEGDNMNGSIYSTHGNYSKNSTTNEAGNHSHSLKINAAGDHSHNITVFNNGGGKAFNIMQPYEVAYRWKRIA